jgi:FAD/FMN-containing dehydrogenase/Fe-S oxidoreductase
LDIRDSTKSKLIQKIKGNVFFDELTRRIYAYSASICYLVPAAVIYPLDTEDVINAIKIASEEEIPVTARGSGSGVAGQNLGEGLILDFSIYMKRILNLNRKKLTVTVEPGLIRSTLNRYLLSEGLFFPPDPSSTDYATIGGMVANNSGGAHSLLYGTTKNYIKNLTLVSADGEEISLTRNSEAPLKYETPIKELLLEASPILKRLKAKSFRNSCGYNLFESHRINGDVDFTKLICGSEGTLGLITKIEIDVLKLPEHRSSVLLCYKDAHSALSEVRNFLDFAPSTIQALAEEFLRLGADEDPDKISKLPKGTNFILLAEFDGNDQEDLERKAHELIKRSSAFSHKFVKNSSDLGWIWTIRQSAAAYLSRLPGDKPTRWIEDAAVPVDRLSEFVLGLEKLLKKYKTSAALFGHAGQGLLHFSPRLNRMSPDFQKLIEDLGHEHALFSKKLDGVPSGEHGDGLLRTPYLKEIWEEVYPYFEKVKKIFDPHFILNPLCIVPVRDYRVSEFLRYYKGYDHKKAGALNQFLNDIEACHGCGKCTDFCPVTRSREGEIGSSRARMNLLREIISGHLKDPFTRRDLLEFFNLCLHCKTCKIECPTRIDVARLIESYFAEKYIHKSPPFADKILSKSRSLGSLVNRMQRPVKKVLRSTSVDKLSAAIGLANLKHMEFNPLRSERLEYRESPEHKRSIIFTGCVGDFFNASEIKAALALLKKIGYKADILSGFCCGEPAFIRGLESEGLKQLKKSIIQLSADVKAKIPAICTSPSCLLPFLEHSEVILEKEEAEKIKKGLHEACSFFVDHFTGIQKDANTKILGMDSEEQSLKHAIRDFFRPVDLKIAVQIPCHLKIIDADQKLLSFIKALSVADIIELETKCCGFGGSRGFEKKWAHHAERIGENLRDEIRSFQPHIVVSSCVTCRFQIRKLLGERTMVSEYDDLHKFIWGEEKNLEKIRVVHPLVLAHELLI